MVASKTLTSGAAPVSEPTAMIGERPAGVEGVGEVGAGRVGVFGAGAAPGSAAAPALGVAAAAFEAAAVGIGAGAEEEGAATAGVAGAADAAAGARKAEPNSESLPCVPSGEPTAMPATEGVTLAVAIPAGVDDVPTAAEGRAGNGGKGRCGAAASGLSPNGELSVCGHKSLVHSGAWVVDWPALLPGAADSGAGGTVPAVREPAPPSLAGATGVAPRLRPCDSRLIGAATEATPESRWKMSFGVSLFSRDSRVGRTKQRAEGDARTRLRPP